jgi:hypothetical protein
VGEASRRLLIKTVSLVSRLDDRMNRELNLLQLSSLSKLVEGSGVVDGEMTKVHEISRLAIVLGMTEAALKVTLAANKARQDLRLSMNDYLRRVGVPSER